MTLKKYADVSLTENEAKEQGIYESAGWNFDDIWELNSNFPTLKNMIEEDDDEQEEIPYRTMYHAMTNSPITEIAESINAEHVDITVIDISVFPPAPNLAVIGDDEHAETILYTEIDGNTLKVQREIEGESRSWGAGTVIARNFTAYDHNSFKENIELLIEELEEVKSKI